MAARASVLVETLDSDAVEELESAMAAGELNAVIVTIPDTSSALLNAREFRQLMSVARANGVEIELSTDDPLRRELAAILGMPMTPLPSAAPPSPTQPDESAGASPRADVTSPGPLARPAASDELTRRIDTALKRPPPRIVMPSDEDDANEADRDNDESQASFSFVLTPPAARRDPYDPPRVLADDDEIDAMLAPSPARRAPTLRKARLRVIAVMSSIGSLLGVGLFVIALVAPTATVTLVPAVTPVSVDFTYGVAAPGASYDLVVQPRAVSATLTYTTSIPTTGTRQIPDATARGELLLTNPTTSDVMLPEGTIFTADGGQEFATEDDVLVPAADPFGTQSFGAASVNIVAQTAGSDGNVDAEAIYGQLEGGVFYSNQAAVSGGSMKSVNTVAQADLDALRGKALTALQRQADGALGPQLQAGEQLLDNSTQTGAPSVTFDKAAGADGASVSVNASQTVSGQAYDPAALQAQARAEAGQRLAASVGAGTVVLAETVKLGDPQPVSSDATIAFRIRATADTRAVIEPSTLDALRHDLRNAGRQATEQRLDALTGVASHTVEYGPSWLPSGLPRLRTQVTIKVVDGAGTESASAVSSSAP